MMLLLALLPHVLIVGCKPLRALSRLALLLVLRRRTRSGRRARRYLRLPPWPLCDVDGGDTPR